MYRLDWCNTGKGGAALRAWATHAQPHARTQAHAHARAHTQAQTGTERRHTDARAREQAHTDSCCLCETASACTLWGPQTEGDSNVPFYPGFVRLVSGYIGRHDRRAKLQQLRGAHRVDLRSGARARAARGGDERCDGAAMRAAARLFAIGAAKSSTLPGSDRPVPIMRRHAIRR